jgi:hypothetical protein
MRKALFLILLVFLVVLSSFWGSGIATATNYGKIAIGIPTHDKFEQGDEVAIHAFTANEGQMLATVVGLPHASEPIEVTVTNTLTGEIMVSNRDGVQGTFRNENTPNAVMYLPAFEATNGSRYIVEIAREAPALTAQDYMVSVLEVVSDDASFSSTLRPGNSIYLVYIQLESTQSIVVTLTRSDFDGTIGLGRGEVEQAHALNSQERVATFYATDTAVYTMLYMSTLDDQENTGPFSFEVDFIENGAN